MKYKHLTTTERELIAKKLRLGMSIRAIALALERSPSSISREIRRNSLHKIYAPETARLAIRSDGFREIVGVETDCAENAVT
jgi:IS30 family transposase